MAAWLTWAVSHPEQRQATDLQNLGPVVRLVWSARAGPRFSVPRPVAVPKAALCRRTPNPVAESGRNGAVRRGCRPAVAGLCRKGVEFWRGAGTMAGKF